MPVIAVIGAQWGDEGKGKIVDMLADKSDMIIRFSGGDNAGHTVVNSNGEFKLHIVPSGIFSTTATSIIGNGVVLNPKVLLAEIAGLKERGIDTSRLFISDRANIIMPWHLLLDGLDEDARAASAIGTTRKGIGPAFSDKIARLGIRAGDLLDKAYFKERLHHIIVNKNLILHKVYGVKSVSEKEVYNQYYEYGDQMAPYITDTTFVIEEAMARDDSILLEGAQGALLDPDFGTYPYTTSSSPLAAGSCQGAGIGPTLLSQVLGVFKVYTTRVGGGPLPTELKDETGEWIRQKAHEFGTTTGRPRRCGWFDGVAARFSTRINGFTSIALTRLDVFDDIKSVKICVGYRLNGENINYFPANIQDLEKCEPIYEEMPGWMADTSKVRSFDKLPPNARKYVARLQKLICAPISIISVGMRREQTIVNG